MRNALRAALFALAALLPDLAHAQVNNQNLPANTVIGRLGIGPGPSQAIPLAVLLSNLGGLTAPVTFAQIQTIAALSVFGNCTNAIATGAAVTGAANQVLRVNGAATACAFGAIDLSQSAAVTNTLPFNNLPTLPADNVAANPTGSTAIMAALPLVNCASSLTYNTSTHAFGCNAGAGSGNVTGPGSSVNNHIATYNGTTGQLLQDGGVPIGIGTGGIFDAVVVYGADPTFAANSTTAINNCIAAACPSVNGTCFLPPGHYKVNGGLNMTNITGGHVSGGCRLRGAGMTATLLETTTSTNAALDLTGSSSIIIEDMWIRSGSGTAYGALLSASNTLPCNVIKFNNVTFDGLFSEAGVYVNNCSDGLFEHGAVASSSGNAAPADMAFTATNPFGATSSYTTISAVTPAQSGDWTFVDWQIHDLAQASGTSTVIPLYISGSFSPIKYFGGIIAGSVAAGSGTVTFDGVSPGLFSAIGTQFYGDNGTQSATAFYARTSTTGITIQDCSVLYSSAFMGITSAQAVTRLSITGNKFSGGSFIAANSGNVTVAGGIVDASNLAINLGAGGSLTHMIMIQPGTLTAGTQANNGSF